MTKTLYKNKAGNTLVWTIEAEAGRTRVTSGRLGGSLVTSTWKKCLPKNIGKANETTAESQAGYEAQALIKKKMENGYQETVPEADSTPFEPTFAKLYGEFSHKVQWDSAYGTPKLDGMRCVARKSGFLSRKRKPITSVPHIVDSLAPFFEKFPDAILDGELYTHELKHDFNALISITRKSDVAGAEAEKAKSMQYWVFDVVLDAAYPARIEWLRTNLKSQYPYIHIVEPTKLETPSAAEDFKIKQVALGYEGAMLRWGNVPYLQGRNPNLLKIKDLVDEEALILGVIEGEGNRSGMLGKFQLRFDSGVDFESNMKGTFEQYKQIFDNPERYIGKKATVEYQGLYPDSGKPRFPRVKAIRDYE
jgi:DNA ligase-1